LPLRYDLRMSRRIAQISAVLTCLIVLAGCSAGSSAQTGDAKACTIFAAWNGGKTNGTSVLHDWHNATTAALIRDLTKLSNDMLASQIRPSQQAAQTVLTQAASVQAECAALGH
jgi:hypothetical protein